MIPSCQKRRSELYWMLVFATVILASYSQFLLARRIEAEPWKLALTFGLGMAYAFIFLVGSRIAESSGPRAIQVYFALQCGLLTALMFIGPSRGIFFIIALPVVSQSLFDLGRRGASVTIGYLYVMSVASVVWRHGWPVFGDAIVSLAASYVFTIAFTIITVQALNAKDQAERLRAELEAANQQLQAQAAAREELATTRERNRLAREIHDGVGHYLTVIKVQLDAASALLPNDSARAVESVQKAARLASEALDDVRRSVGTLAADATRPPLLATLRQLAADGTPASEVRVEGTPRPLSSAAEHALFRTAQEGLTNVRKHAAASTATLTLDFSDPSRVRLVLADNGRGATAAPVNGSGFGLRGLRERIALLGGTLTTCNRPEGGFMLQAEVPA